MAVFFSILQFFGDSSFGMERGHVTGDGRGCAARGSIGPAENSFQFSRPLTRPPAKGERGSRRSYFSDGPYASA